MRFFIVSMLLLLSPFLNVFGQSISISPDGSPPDSSAILDIKSTSRGLLIPRMTIAQRDAIPIPAYGLTIFQTNGIPGMYYYDGSAWTPVDASSSSGNWLQSGNDIYNNNSGNIGIGTSAPEGKLHIKGNTDVSQLIIEASGTQSDTNPLIRLRKSDGTDLMWIHSNSPYNVFIGKYAGRVNTGFDAVFNTFVGSNAGYSNINGFANTAIGYGVLYSNTYGGKNTAIGYDALANNSTGENNTAIGSYALVGNTRACQNTALGSGALQNQSYNSTGPWESNNTAIGYNALYANQPLSIGSGISNTAVGSYALTANTTGWDNSAFGTAALYSNTTGIENTALGRQALFYNTSGNGNTSIGYKTLRGNTTGDNNTAMGYYALFNNTSAFQNTAIGYYALYNTTYGYNNVSIGTFSLEHNIGGSENIAIGYNSGTSVNSPNIYNTISIGNNGFSNGLSNHDFIGNLNTEWIGGQTTWYTYASDARVKNNVQEDVKGLDFIRRLRPVTYNLDITAMREITDNKDTEDYPEKFDIERIKQSGFLAQEVEQAALASGYNFNGFTRPKTDKELYTMSYSLFVVPLVKAVQELSQENTQLKNALNLMKSENENLAKRIEKIESIVSKK